MMVMVVVVVVMMMTVMILLMAGVTKQGTCFHLIHANLTLKKVY
jgi:hypothetical protein